MKLTGNHFKVTITPKPAAGDDQFEIEIIEVASQLGMFSAKKVHQHDTSRHRPNITVLAEWNIYPAMELTT